MDRSSALVQRVAHTLAYLLHPAVLLLVTMALLNIFLPEAGGRGLLDMGILLLGLLPGLSYIAWKVRRGAVSHPHLLFKEERRIVLPLFLLGLLGSLLLYKLTGAPDFLLEGMAIGLLEGVGLTIITRFWKISFHAAVSMSCAAFLLPVSAWLALIMATAALIVGWARLPVNHHTLAQVIGGWAYGFGVTLALLALLTEYL
jgi:membrane-associated phospholipid phosphatase